MSALHEAFPFAEHVLPEALRSENFSAKGQSDADLATHASREEVERALAEVTGGLKAPLAEICAYLLQGGRRTRSLVLLSACRQPGQRALRAAISLELLHAATLLQDDIFDESRLRRGRPCAHRVFGCPLAILASDWLLLESLRRAAAVHPSFFHRLSEAAQQMTTGEARELSPSPLADFRRAETYLHHIAAAKTGVLFGVALGYAGLLDGLDDDRQGQQRQLGIELGVTFQMADDACDALLSSAETGKDSQQDLIAGRLTLPVLAGVRALEREPDAPSLHSVQSKQLSRRQQLRLFQCMRSTQVRNAILKQLAARIDAHHRAATHLGLEGPIRMLTQQLTRDLLHSLASS